MRNSEKEREPYPGSREPQHYGDQGNGRRYQPPRDQEEEGRRGQRGSESQGGYRGMESGYGYPVRPGNEPDWEPSPRGGYQSYGGQGGYGSQYGGRYGYEPSGDTREPWTGGTPRSYGGWSGEQGWTGSEGWNERGPSSGGYSRLSSMGRQGRHYGKGPKNYQRSDERLKEELSDHLMKDGELDASQVSIEVKNGEVTLEGTVPDRRTKREIEDCAEGVMGVKDVTNRLRVQSSTHGEDQSQSAWSQSGQKGQTSGSSTTGTKAKPY